MTLNKYISAFFLIVFSITSTLSQKYFEGKITQDVVYTNGWGNSRNITYYKNNKSRTDLDKLTGDNPYTSISISDFEKRERLMLMDMPKIKTKSATLSDMILIEKPISKIEKVDEYKMILNHKCQKATLTSIVNGKETKVIGYADFNYLLKTLIDFSGKTIDYPLFFESEIITTTMGTITSSVVSISEDPLSDDIFNSNIPADYKLIDIRKKVNASVPVNDNAGNSSDNEQKEDYNQYTNSELEAKLATALKVEDFDTAVKLKEVIEKRNGPLLKFNTKTITELQDMLKVAVSNEEFERANQIQEEIKKRAK